MVNLRLVALIVGTYIPVVIVLNLLEMVGLESAFLLIEAGLIVALVCLVLFVSYRRNIYTHNGQILVPVPLKSRLDIGEEIVSSLTGQQDVDWYLTNKRLIRFQKNDLLKMVKEPIGTIPTQGLVFQFNTKTSARKIAFWCLGALLFVIGVFMVTIGYLGSINSTYSSSLGMRQDVALSIGTVGFGVLFFAVVVPAINFSFYQFLHPDLENAGSDEKLWRLRETLKNKEPLKQFLGDIEKFSQNPPV